MSLSKRLAILVACAILGLILLAGFALQTLRNTMLEDRRNEIYTVLNLAAKQVAYFQQQESSGKLSRDEAQARAIDALSNLRDGKKTYLWARTTGALGLVHPNPDVIGKVDWGATLASGKSNFQTYLDALSNTNFAFFDDMTKKPGTDVAVPKINGVTKIGGWDWIVGFGIFVDDIDTAFWNLVWYFLGIVLVILALVAALATTMARSILKRLGGEPDYAASVAREIANGNLSHHLAGRFGDDSLLGSIAHMQLNLRQMIENIQRGAKQLGADTSSLTNQMSHINTASHDATDATSATAAAIEELAVSIEHITTNARETEEYSERSSTLAANGEQLVNRASETIQGVSVQIGESSALIEDLVGKTTQIGGIASVIKDIADQTNLLALNAAIEAARAGELGRGFAVVADEVRKLAERTTQATGQITGMIDAVQSDTASVVNSMRSVAPKVSESVDLAKEAAAALREINMGAETTLSKIHFVASATAEQTQASNSVAQNIERISMMVEESSHAVQAANANVRDLESLATDLRESVARFTL